MYIALAMPYFSVFWMLKYSIRWRPNFVLGIFQVMKFSFKSQYFWNATFLKAPNWSQQEVLKRCSAGSWCVCLVVTLSPIPLFLILSFEAPCLASANISGQEFPIFIIAFKAQYFQVVLYCNFLIKMKKSHSTYERMFETLPCLPFEFQKFHCLVLTKNNKWNHKAIAGFLWHSMPHFGHRYYFNALSFSPLGNTIIVSCYNGAKNMGEAITERPAHIDPACWLAGWPKFQPLM